MSERAYSDHLSLSRDGSSVLIAVTFTDEDEARGFLAALIERGKTEGRIDLVLHTGPVTSVS
jgi:hypothetical protein